MKNIYLGIKDNYILAAISSDSLSSDSIKEARAMLKDLQVVKLTSTTKYYIKLEEAHSKWLFRPNTSILLTNGKRKDCFGKSYNVRLNADVDAKGRVFFNNKYYDSFGGYGNSSSGSIMDTFYLPMYQGEPTYGKWLIVKQG